MLFDTSARPKATRITPATLSNTSCLLPSNCSFDDVAAHSGALYERLGCDVRCAGAAAGMPLLLLGGGGSVMCFSELQPQRRVCCQLVMPSVLDSRPGCHTSHVTRHTPHATRHSSLVTCESGCRRCSRAGMLRNADVCGEGSNVRFAITSHCRRQHHDHPLL